MLISWTKEYLAAPLMRWSMRPACKKILQPFKHPFNKNTISTQTAGCVLQLITSLTKAFNPLRISLKQTFIVCVCIIFYSF